MIEQLKILGGLIKVRIALAVVLSTAVGYLAFNHRVDDLLVWVSLGVFLLASGSAAINHLQEAQSDGLMARTSDRPLPSGKLSVISAILIALGFSLAGVVVLFITCGWLPALLGLFTLVWYNAVYTPLKSRTPYALLIGALVGAIPPAIGYTAAGGGLTDASLLLLCVFYFVWQVPHFLLLLLRYGDEYLHAGFKPLSQFLMIKQLSALTLTWIVSLVIVAAFLPVAGLIARPAFMIVQGVVSLIFIAVSIPILKPANHSRHLPRMFRIINGFMLLISHLVMLDQLL